jgi:hypothetical protein
MQTQRVVRVLDPWARNMIKAIAADYNLQRRTVLRCATSVGEIDD